MPYLFAVLFVGHRKGQPLHIMSNQKQTKEPIGKAIIGTTVYTVYSEFDKRPMPKENQEVKREGETLPWAK